MGRRVAMLVLVAAFLAGLVFALQGMALLPSRLMYGKAEWIVIGVVMIVASGGVLLRLVRR